MIKRFKESRALRVTVPSLVGLCAFLGFTGTANAALDPAIKTAIDGAFADTQSLILTVIAVAAFALMVVLLGVKLGMKWVSRVANK